MKYFELEPEVAGGWGDSTEADVSVHPPKVKKLHYQFDGWSGDTLLESFPCFIITVATATACEETKLTGFRLAPVKITQSEQFKELYGEKELPPFKWFQIVGRAGFHDFGLSRNFTLVVSEKALNVLRHFEIENCKVGEWQG